MILRVVHGVRSRLRIPRHSATQSAGKLPPSLWQSCHPVHRKAAASCMARLPLMADAACPHRSAAMPERRRLTLSCSFSPLREVKTGQLTVFLNSFHSSDVVGLYYIANEISTTYQGMMIAVPAPEWDVFYSMSPVELAAILLELAQGVRLQAIRKSPRRPKKPRPQVKKPARTCCNG